MRIIAALALLVIFLMAAAAYLGLLHLALR